MILGIYWYFKFQENLYHFQFFKFSGGFVDKPAKLEGKAYVNIPKELIKKLEKLQINGGIYRTKIILTSYFN
ncbi:hypothetical protein [Chryseobacterium sp.]|uniref:hypothetical protein n=1 Tax=Chryseobacterium sp. TaxID=1871047 RepID=UPI0025B7B787|nr:hypothetical protein [Chryseobacterium sp.]